MNETDEIINLEPNTEEEQKEITSEITAEILQERLMQLEAAFEPFYKGCGFYAVEITLQGGFDAMIAKVAFNLGYKSTISPYGYITLIKGNIKITLT